MDSSREQAAMGYGTASSGRSHGGVLGAAADARRGGRRGQRGLARPARSNLMDLGRDIETDSLPVGEATSVAIGELTQGRLCSVLRSRTQTRISQLQFLQASASSPCSCRVGCCHGGPWKLQGRM
ncbi:hypothetical protein SEVIR_9G229750v4 [Setaria viridis]|uniref:Uncharacterized protein n=1 Tax=Setaria viridis TaxID=4556 RepID=A0A4U6SZ94_SETVI|nr:hypothetical protein SEVIR_9G229750v2 [Setaria viridis]